MTPMQEHDTIYANPKFRDVDVGSLMRVGHPDIAEGDALIASLVRKHRTRLGRPLKIIDIGSGSGDLSLLLASSLPDCEVMANEVAPNPAEQARVKLNALPNAAVFDRPFQEWREQVDIAISWGSHHHIGHDYLKQVHEVLSSDGLLLIGDEFCPEYLTPSDQARLSRAETILVVDGYIFDNEDDVAEYRRTGNAPEWSATLELARRRALWTWYKFVGDYAVAHGHWQVLIAELAIARDDLVTEFDEEHKTSPYLLERELALNGFTLVSRDVIGARPAKLQSFVVYAGSPG
jgi:cyclopropane fatty-acyl-phospholipid synthase-like methyltransferase